MNIKHWCVIYLKASHKAGSGLVSTRDGGVFREELCSGTEGKHSERVNTL